MQKLCHALLVENVPEYGEVIVASELGPLWSTKSCVIDPRIFGVPASRSRRYIIAWCKETVQWREDVHLEDIIDILTSYVVADAGIFFWKECPKTNLSAAQVVWLTYEIISHLIWFSTLWVEIKDLQNTSYI